MTEKFVHKVSLGGHLLASTSPRMMSTAVRFVDAYRIITVDELPLYVDFKYKTDVWDKVLHGSDDLDKVIEELK